MSNTLQSRREHHRRFRAFVLARDLNELKKGLLKIANDEEIMVENSDNSDGQLAVFFSPQGGEFQN